MRSASQKIHTNTHQSKFEAASRGVASENAHGSDNVMPSMCDSLPPLRLAAAPFLTHHRAPSAAVFKPNFVTPDDPTSGSESSESDHYKNYSRTPSPTSLDAVRGDDKRHRTEARRRRRHSSSRNGDVSAARQPVVDVSFADQRSSTSPDSDAAAKTSHPLKKRLLRRNDGADLLSSPASSRADETSPNAVAFPRSPSSSQIVPDAGSAVASSPASPPSSSHLPRGVDGDASAHSSEILCRMFATFGAATDAAAPPVHAKRRASSPSTPPLRRPVEAYDVGSKPFATSERADADVPEKRRKTHHDKLATPSASQSPVADAARRQTISSSTKRSDATSRNNHARSRHKQREQSGAGVDGGGDLAARLFPNRYMLPYVNPFLFPPPALGLTYPPAAAPLLPPAANPFLLNPLLANQLLLRELLLSSSQPIFPPSSHFRAPSTIGASDALPKQPIAENRAVVAEAAPRRLNGADGGLGFRPGAGRDDATPASRAGECPPYHRHQAKKTSPPTTVPRVGAAVVSETGMFCAEAAPQQRQCDAVDDRRGAAAPVAGKKKRARSAKTADRFRANGERRPKKSAQLKQVPGKKREPEVEELPTGSPHPRAHREHPIPDPSEGRGHDQNHATRAMDDDDMVAGAGHDKGDGMGYKNLTRERRLVANARERTRVHTISSAFDELRMQIPSYSCNQKLSKLAILRIACSYIRTLSALSGRDETTSFSQGVDQCTRVLQAESRARSRRKSNRQQIEWEMASYERRSADRESSPLPRPVVPSAAPTSARDAGDDDEIDVESVEGSVSSSDDVFQRCATSSTAVAVSGVNDDVT